MSRTRAAHPGRLPRRLLHRPLLAAAVAVAGAATAFAAAVLPDGNGLPAGRASPAVAGTAAGPSAEDRLLHDAEQRLLRDCMRRQGFTYQVFALDEEPGVEAFPYVLDDSAWAGRHGYGSALRGQRAARARSDPNRAYFAALPPDRKARALAAANGPTPRGLSTDLPGGGTVERSGQGCVAESQDLLYGDVAAWFRASTRVEALERIRRGRVTADAGYRGPLARWERCMRGAGHPYATPAQTRAAALSPTRPLGTAREVALALAEVRCGAASGLAATARRLDAHHAASLARTYRADVEQWERLRAAALPRARRITGEPPRG